MNAINPVSAAAGAEPSMEEILASIRRIIADDQSLPGHGGSPQPPKVPLAEPPRAEPLATEPLVAEPPHAAVVRALPDVPVDLPPERGVTAAPQLVSPEGPARVMDTPHPLAPPASDAARTGAEGSALHEPVPYEPILDRLDAPEPDPHEAALHAMHDGPGVDLHDFVSEEPSHDRARRFRGGAGRPVLGGHEPVAGRRLQHARGQPAHRRFARAARSSRRRC